MAKTALVFGATGLVGSHLVKQLIAEDDFEQVKVFNRKRIDYPSEKVKTCMVNFDDLNSIKNNITGDVLFCCIGTTIKKAGNREAFSSVDLDIPVALAGLAYDNGVDHFIVISSIGAKARSANFYSRTKGLMEHAIRSYRFQRITIVRPSLLLGKREEVRRLEQLGIFMARSLGFLMVGRLRKFKPINAETVALAMVRMARMGHNRKVFESHQIWEIANNS